MRNTRHPNNKVNNPAFQKWLQDDQDLKKSFGYSMNSWLTLTPSTANKLSVQVDGVGNRGFAIHNNLGYYEQKIIQIYLSAGLDKRDFVAESIGDFLTEIALNSRLLLNFLKPRHDTAIRHRIYGVPAFSIKGSFSQQLEQSRPWANNYILKSSDPCFANERTLTIKLMICPNLFPDDGSRVRAQKIKIPGLVFAIFSFGKTKFGLSYSFSSEYVPEEIALKYLALDAKLSTRTSDNPIRNKRIYYHSDLKFYKDHPPEEYDLQG